MARRQIQAKTLLWEALSADLFLFARMCGFYPTWQQWQLFDAVMRGERSIAVKSGQGPGKTTASAILGLWLALRNKGAKVLVVAPTLTQAKETWLSTAKKLMLNADPRVRQFFDFSETGVGIRLKDYSQKTWGILLRGAGGKVEAAQGQHDENMHIIFEEASGISAEITEQYEGTLSNPNAIFLKIGNPNSRNCPFFDCFNKDKHSWETFTWNAEHTPESKWYTHKKDRNLAEKYGKDSDPYRIRVLGEFPHTEPNCLLSFEDMEPCMEDSLQMKLMAKTDEHGLLPKRFGMDFARFGGDENTIFQRQGYSILQWGFWPHTEPADVVDRSFEMQREYAWSNNDTLYIPDACGIGQGLMHMFHRANKNVFEFQNQLNASNHQEYDDIITEAWFEFAGMAKAGGIYIPQDSRMIEQLTTRRYYFTKQGKMCLESKKEYTKRGYDSPDRAEGCILSFYPHASAGMQIA